MSEASAAAAVVDDSSPLEPAWLLRLFGRPRQFFALDHALNQKPELFLVVWLAGMSNVLGRIDMQLAKAGSGTPTSSDIFVRLAQSWSSVWIAVVLGGVLSGGLAWLIGGWWYGLRLHLCGARPGHEHEGRRTWAYVSLATSLPAIVVLLIQTVRYDSYAEAYNTSSALDLLLLALLYWSVVVSYRAATTRFKLDTSKARFWFLVLPLAFYTVVIVMLGLLSAALGPGNASIAA
ncbi:MAG: hypothetical protein R2910_05145 [Gemmatimonadales bacterium]